MNWKFTSAATAAAAAVSWLGWTPPHTAAPRAGNSVASSRDAVAASDIAREAVKLEARPRAATVYRQPERDPFRFAERPAARPVPSVVTPAVEAQAPPAVPAPAIPVMKLAGIASDVIDGITTRTAILSTAEGVVLAREGEDAAGYRVIRIEEERVELEAVADGSRLELRY